MLKLACALVAFSAISGCATHYMDSAESNHGGRFVVGAYDHKATVFHCPAKPGQGDCERVDVDFK